MLYAKQKQLGAIKRVLPSKVESMLHITEFDWKEQILMISTCGQVDWNIIIINILKELVRTRTDIKLRPSGYSFPML